MLGMFAMVGLVVLGSFTERVMFLGNLSEFSVLFLIFLRVKYQTTLHYQLAHRYIFCFINVVAL